MLLWQGELSLYLGPTQKCFREYRLNCVPMPEAMKSYTTPTIDAFLGIPLSQISDISKLQSSDRKLRQ